MGNFRFNQVCKYHSDPFLGEKSKSISDLVTTLDLTYNGFSYYNQFLSQKRTLIAFMLKMFIAMSTTYNKQIFMNLNYSM